MTWEVESDVVSGESVWRVTDKDREFGCFDQADARWLCDVLNGLQPTAATPPEAATSPEAATYHVRGPWGPFHEPGPSWGIPEAQLWPEGPRPTPPAGWGQVASWPDISGGQGRYSSAEMAQLRTDVRELRAIIDAVKSQLDTLCDREEGPPYIDFDDDEPDDQSSEPSPDPLFAPMVKSERPESGFHRYDLPNLGELVLHDALNTQLPKWWRIVGFEQAEEYLAIGPRDPKLTLQLMPRAVTEEDFYSLVRRYSPETPFALGEVVASWAACIVDAIENAGSQFAEKTPPYWRIATDTLLYHIRRGPVTLPEASTDSQSPTPAERSADPDSSASSGDASA